MYYKKKKKPKYSLFKKKLKAKYLPKKKNKNKKLVFNNYKGKTNISNRNPFFFFSFLIIGK